MKKVYIAAAFRQFSLRANESQAYGEVGDLDYIAFLERIETIFLRHGYATCLPHRDEGKWGRVYYEPAAISALCFRHVETSDAIFAIAEGGRGVHIEVGFAAGLGGKDIILMFKKGSEPSTLIWGLGDVAGGRTREDAEAGSCYIAEYLNIDDIENELDIILQANQEAARKIDRKRKKVGVIDIGSHTLKMKIVSIAHGGQPMEVTSDRASIGIIDGLTAGSALSDETMSQIMSFVATWADECMIAGCEQIKIVGTAALRSASNASALSAALYSRTGVYVEILSPEVELGYVYRGVRSTFASNDAMAVLNLGGGSTQVGIGGKHDLLSVGLLDFGTRAITREYPWIAPYTVDQFDELVSVVVERIQRGLDSLRLPAVSTLVHTGGELDFLLRCGVRLSTSFGSSVHVSKLTVDEFRAFAHNFCSHSLEAVATRFGLDPAWAAGSVASNAIALAIAECVGASTIVPSNLNIVDGIALSVLE